jgi:hypothetical protein
LALRFGAGSDELAVCWQIFSQMRHVENQISVKAQQIMMSACDIAFRGNPGNIFSSILRNRDFERRPLHARHVFLFVMHPMLALFIEIKARHFSLLPLPYIHPRRNYQFWWRRHLLLLFRCTYFCPPRHRCPWFICLVHRKLN